MLHAAVGTPVADYLSSRIWQPLGAEADAGWAIDRTEQEATFCCLSATLRDYARLGLMLAHDGAWNGRQIVPRDWVLEATTASPERPHLMPGRATPAPPATATRSGCRPARDGPSRCLASTANRSPSMPTSKLVMVQTAVRPMPANVPGRAGRPRAVDCASREARERVKRDDVSSSCGDAFPPPCGGGPTRPERPSGVGGAGVEHGGGKLGIVGAPRTCPDVRVRPSAPHPYPSPQGGGESASASPEPRPIKPERISRQPLFGIMLLAGRHCGSSGASSATGQIRRGCSGSERSSLSQGTR